MFGEIFKDKKVIITGHTGFKGSWLTSWLILCGAKIIGISKDIPTNPSAFKVLRLENKIKHYICDLRDLEKLKRIINIEKPDFIFHLAAQAIVSISKENPIDTISSNAFGTLNLLEILRKFKKKCSVVLITSDKSYYNSEWVWGYRETDVLGGDDIYSGSKAATEMIIKSYLKTYFGENHPVKIGIGRAGNVIGGGDWAKDRIVADCFRSWSNQEKVVIRSPYSTRPWQHVLEPLSGYLLLAKELHKLNLKVISEAFNFGPKSEQNKTVLDLIKDLSSFIEDPAKSKNFIIRENNKLNESKLLKLNCDKALFNLSWEPNLDYSETVRFVGEWYVQYFKDPSKISDLTLSQIDKYCLLAINRKRKWIK